MARYTHLTPEQRERLRRELFRPGGAAQQAAQQSIFGGSLNPFQGLIDTVNNPMTWFNVVGVVLGVFLIVIGLVFILRKAS